MTDEQNPYAWQDLPHDAPERVARVLAYIEGGAGLGLGRIEWDTIKAVLRKHSVAELPVNKMTVPPYQQLDLPTDNGRVAVDNATPYSVDVIARRVPVNRQPDPTRCTELGCGNMGTRADGKCGYHTLQGPCIGGCEHDWKNVVDVCKDKPCNGQVLGRRCVNCGVFDGSRVNRTSERG